MVLFFVVRFVFWKLEILSLFIFFWKKIWVFLVLFEVFLRIYLFNSCFLGVIVRYFCCSVGGIVDRG